MDQMTKDYARDYAFKNRLRDVRIELAGFLNEPNSRLWPKTHAEIQTVIALLVEQENHIVAVWD